MIAKDSLVVVVVADVSLTVAGVDVPTVRTEREGGRSNRRGRGGGGGGEERRYRRKKRVRALSITHTHTHTHTCTQPTCTWTVTWVDTCPSIEDHSKGTEATGHTLEGADWRLVGTCGRTSSATG